MILDTIKDTKRTLFTLRIGKNKKCKPPRMTFHFIV